MALDREVYARRRREFIDRIGPGAAAILRSAPPAVRSNDVEYRYRQDSDLLYLTGFPEPESAALFLPGHSTEEFVLFVRPRDAEREAWTGPRAGVEDAMERYGAAAAYTIDKLDEQVRKYLADRDRLYFGTGRDEAFGRRLLDWLREWQTSRPRTGGGPTALLDAGAILHEMRLRKSPEEVDLIRQAIAVTAKAHVAAMEARRPGMREYELEALLDHHFRAAGATGPAYPSIVASGPNATVLHYIDNDREMRDGDLVLIDAGAEFEAYCADITRTYPVGRDFGGRQRAVYDIVWEAHEAAIAAIVPGIRMEDVHGRAVRVIAEGLVANHLLSGSVEEIVEKEMYKPFYMHRSGHWLGLDVHDVGQYKIEGQWRILEPGMVLTVEPGLYLAPNNADVDPAWSRIGVRIEDDVLVTAAGCEVLSAAIPRLPADLE